MATQATGRYTCASGQYPAGRELIGSGGGSVRKRSTTLCRKVRTQGSGSTSKRNPWRGTAPGSTGIDLNNDCMGDLIFLASEKDYISCVIFTPRKQAS